MNKKRAFERYLAVCRGAQRTIASLMLWDEKKTTEDNAKVLKIPYSSAVVFKGRYGLKARPHDYLLNRPKFKWSDLRDKVGRAAALKRKGLTFEEIGKVFGVTRQRVEQVLKQYKQTALNGKGETPCKQKKQ